MGFCEGFCETTEKTRTEEDCSDLILAGCDGSYDKLACGSPEIAALIELLGGDLLDSTLDLGEDDFQSFHGSWAATVAEKQQIRSVVADHMRCCASCKRAAEGEALKTESVYRKLKGNGSHPNATARSNEAADRPKARWCVLMQRTRAMAGALGLNRFQRAAILLISSAAILLKLRDSHFGFRAGAGAAIGLILLATFLFKVFGARPVSGGDFIKPVPDLALPAKSQLSTIDIHDRVAARVIAGPLFVNGLLDESGSPAGRIIFSEYATGDSPRWWPWGRNWVQLDERAYVGKRIVFAMDGFILKMNGDAAFDLSSRLRRLWSIEFWRPQCGSSFKPGSSLRKAWGVGLLNTEPFRDSLRLPYFTPGSYEKWNYDR